MHVACLGDHQAARGRGISNAWRGVICYELTELGRMLIVPLQALHDWALENPHEWAGG
jgi:hypothetical protein